jgi:uncharacterized protein
MMRILFWLALIALVVFAVRAKVRSAAARAQAEARAQGLRDAPVIAAESMTACAHCGLHFPASEAVRADGLDYCSPAHVRLPLHR